MQKYSVLMSVYNRENPKYLHTAMLSMINQTVKTDDFVLVCDGPLTDELNLVIESFKENHGDILNVVRLPNNNGLGIALNEGLKYCKHELIARMDSDDISEKNRCKKQLKVFENNPDVVICSGTIEEFIDSEKNIVGKRELPSNKRDIINFSKKRCPFNHVAVMFKKTEIINAGGYREKYHFFEDYDLWIRVLRANPDVRNIKDTLALVRTSKDLYARRGGGKYASDMLRFHRMLKNSGWSSSLDYLTGALPHAVVCFLPVWIRKSIYIRLLRKSDNGNGKK